MRVMTADPVVIRTESASIVEDPESDVHLGEVPDKVVAVFRGQILYE